MTEPQAPDATVEALAGATFTYRTSSNVPLPPDWWQRQSASMRAPFLAEAEAVLAAIPDYRLVPAEEWERLERIESAAEELAHFEEGGGFRANHPEDLFTALRAALAHPAEAEEKPDAV